MPRSTKFRLPFLIAAALPSTLHAANITVTSLVDSLTVPGQTTFRGALLTANADAALDTIDFAPSLFTSGPATLSMAGIEFSISNSVNILGPGQSSLIIDGQQFSRIFNVTSNTAQVSISGMTLTRGLAQGSSGPASSGGAIYNNGNLSLQNLTISNSRSNSVFILTDTTNYGGGGIYNYRATLAVNNVNLLNNSTSNSIKGGGILSTGGTVNVQNSTFTGNTAGGYGDAYAGTNGATALINTSTADSSIESVGGATGGLTLTNSQAARVTVSGNSLIANSTTGDVKTVLGLATISNSKVGKIYQANFGNLNVDNTTLARLQQDYGNAVVKNSTFKSTNPGDYALSVGNGLGTTLLENVTVTGYTTSGNGTLAFPDGANATIRNSTISGNSASRGGGIYVASGTLSMESSIVAGNTASVLANDISGFVDGEHNLVGDTTGAFLLDANNITGLDPLLGPLADNGGPTYTLMPLPGSPAINQGSNPQNLLFDQRGFARVALGAPDIGAVEVPEPASLAVLLATLPLVFRRRRPASASWSKRSKQRLGYPINPLSRHQRM